MVKMSPEVTYATPGPVALLIERAAHQPSPMSPTHGSSGHMKGITQGPALRRYGSRGPPVPMVCHEFLAPKRFGAAWPECCTILKGLLETIWKSLIRLARSRAPSRTFCQWTGQLHLRRAGCGGARHGGHAGIALEIRPVIASYFEFYNVFPRVLAGGILITGRFLDTVLPMRTTRLPQSPRSWATFFGAVSAACESRPVF